MTLDAASVSAIIALAALTAALWLTGREARQPHPDLDRAATNLSRVLTIGLSLLAATFLVLLALWRDGVIFAAVFGLITALAYLPKHKIRAKPARPWYKLYVMRVPLAFIALITSIYAWGRALSA